MQVLKTKILINTKNIMKKITYFIMLFIIIIALESCNSGGNSSREKTSEELRAELKIQEESNPTRYMTVDAKMKDSIVQTRKEGFFHSAEYAKNGNVIKGVVKNSASVAKFKDMVLTVSYYSATNTEIKSEDHIFYEFYGPNSSKPFSLYVHAPEEMKSFSLSLKNATAVN
jgi:hypothetical protein